MPWGVHIQYSVCRKLAKECSQYYFTEIISLNFSFSEGGIDCIGNREFCLNDDYKQH